VSIFQEATDRAIQLTEAPIAIFNFFIESQTQIAAVTGLEKLPNISKNSDLKVELSGIEFCDRATIDSDGCFFVDDCGKDSDLQQSSLYQLHGIRSYLGVPVLTAAGDPIGTIGILDFFSRQFSPREISGLQIISKWIGSEFERKLLLQAQIKQWSITGEYPTIYSVDDEGFYRKQKEGKRIRSQLHIEDPKLELLDHLSQELRTPLTAILGMARVLQQEIYGPLSLKQKSYLDIIRNSGIQLANIIDEIAILGQLDRQKSHLSLKSVDLEMLCRSVIQTVDILAAQKGIKIELDISSERRNYLLDKDKLKNILYYLVSSSIQAMTPARNDFPGGDRILTVLVSSSQDRLKICLQSQDLRVEAPPMGLLSDRSAGVMKLESINFSTNFDRTDVRIRCGLSLSQQLVAIYGGEIKINPDYSGYCLDLPLMVADKSLEN
jgi:hypothetical protein